MPRPIQFLDYEGMICNSTPRRVLNNILCTLNRYHRYHPHSHILFACRVPMHKSSAWAVELYNLFSGALLIQHYAERQDWCLSILSCFFKVGWGPCLFELWVATLALVWFPHPYPQKCTLHKCTLCELFMSFHSLTPAQLLKDGQTLASQLFVWRDCAMNSKHIAHCCWDVDWIHHLHHRFFAWRPWTISFLFSNNNIYTFCKFIET